MSLLISMLVFFCFLSVPMAKDNVSIEENMKNVVKISESFFGWLDQNKSYFAKCIPEKKGNQIVLCDGTRIDIKTAKKYFKMKPAELVSFIKSEKINLEIFCQEKRKSNFKKWCSPNQNNKFFKDVSSLHGQYVPYTNTIVLHSDAYVGSLVHEYFHYKQFANMNLTHGKIYKKDRIEVQSQIISVFDQLIAEISELEKNKKTEEAKRILAHAIKLSELLHKFGFWQKLIDERNLFLTYILFSHELGISKGDVELARKNMKFLCRDTDFKAIINENECEL